MSSSDHTVEPAPLLSSADSPVETALSLIAAAEDAVARARDAVQVRRAGLVVALRAVVADHIAANGGTPDDRVVELVRTLYWEHDNVRVGDIAAGLGCTQRDVRAVAGPRLVQVVCRGCGCAMEAEQTSRTGVPRDVCEPCAENQRRREAEALRAIMSPTYRSDGSPYSNFATPIPADPDVLRRLVDHLQLALRLEGCDNRLTRSRAWAVGQGLDVDLFVAQLETRGGYCDCEVLMNMWF